MQRIEDYALIGDCTTAALVGRDGSIDWLCWPRFDSDACFAALLGKPEHGHWRLAPAGEAKVTRHYRPHSLILETRFETAAGTATVIDFMPRNAGGSHLIRIVRGERGRVAMRTELAIRFGYGANVPWVTRHDPATIRAIAGPDMVVLRSDVRLHGENLHTVGEFEVAAGQETAFVMSYLRSHLPLPPARDALRDLDETERWWRGWASQNKLRGAYDEPVERSLLTLKALTFEPTGGIVAAPTTSLPEMIGGERNWDYRFCWLRDATMTLLALMNAGYYGEAARWRDWLLRAAAGAPSQVQIMYGLAGERRLTEWIVPWLPGYENARPVRIGNAAHNQLQLDVLGEIMDALHQARLGGLPPSAGGWPLAQEFLKHLTNVWTQKDSGIWEVRGITEHFVYSKVMAWVAFDRAIKSAQKFGFEGDISHWVDMRRRIHDEVCDRGYDETRNTFRRAYGSDELDASLLLLAEVGFLPPEDPRIKGTIAAIERELMVDGFLLRYNTAANVDGLPPGEGAFLACSFWLVDAYEQTGRRAEAVELFERLLSLRNDVGLLSEQYDPRTRRLLGNFPQALSHLALVNSASNLAHAEKPAEQRARSKPAGQPVAEPAS